MTDIQGMYKIKKSKCNPVILLVEIQISNDSGLFLSFVSLFLLFFSLTHIHALFPSQPFPYISPALDSLR